MPSFNPFGAVTGRTSATLFEIRLDNEIIVLRGSESEAASQMLRGVVVLCLPAALKIEDVHLRMIGQLKVGWNDAKMTPSGMSNNRVERTTEIFSHRWAPFVPAGGPGSSSRGSTLPAGNYEWPFELVIGGSMAESVEGLTDSHIVYKLKATVARGKLAYDLHTWKPVRVVRTLDPSALELAHAMTVANTWPNKVDYNIAIPQKAVVFGSSISVQMRFTSLLKQLKIGAIKCTLVETQEFTLASNSVATERSFSYSRDIDTWAFEINEEEHYHDLLDEEGQDGYTLEETLPLPKRLAKCVQDVDVHGIKVRHKVKFAVALHNPDGHVSELRATLPVTIFISPNMPLGEDGCLVDQSPATAQAVDAASHAPPLYGEHVLDQLYADMEQTGFVTPAPQSGMNTPFNGRSRRGSSEQLAPLSIGSHPDGAVPPAALSSRLQNLNLVSRNGNYRRGLAGTDSGSGVHTPHSQVQNDSEASSFDPSQLSGLQSAPLSRRTSGEDDGGRYSNLTSGQHTPEHIDFSDLGDLSKVPSYTTAVRTPMRGMSYADVVPNYETVVSATRGPPRSHSGPSLSTMVDGERGLTTLRRNPLSSIGFTSIHPPAPVYRGDPDEIRRLHLLQSREGSPS